MGTLISSGLHKRMFPAPALNFDLVRNLNSELAMYNISAKGEVINLIATKGYAKKWIVFSHGNASCIYQYQNYINKLHNELNVGCIFYNYPGYGLSSGSANPDSCVDSLAAVVKHLNQDLEVAVSDIILMAHSIGTGVTLEYAYKHTWQRPLVLISPFKSIFSLFLDSVPSSVGVYPSLMYISELECPVKIYHGYKDSLIPIVHGQALVQKMKNKSLVPVWLKEADHNNILELISSASLQDVVR